MISYHIGADPEMVLFDKTKATYISAQGMIKGTKRNPFPCERGATQVDGIMAEFNINPASDVDTFLLNITSMMAELARQVPVNIAFKAKPVVYLADAYFNNLSDEEKALGCMPDYNAYTGEQNDPPSAKIKFRCAGGHIHVGFDCPFNTEDEAQIDIRNRVKQLDHTLFFMSLLWDEDDRRRQLYGKPGAFRYKPYGFEYRVLSNAWMENYDIRRYVFEATVKAMKLYDDGVIFYGDEAPADAYNSDSLVEYHDLLVKEYEFPKLPVRYVDPNYKVAA